MGKGGAGNEYIFTNIIQYSKINKEIADNAIFGIQLSEVLRTLMCFTFPELNEATIGFNTGKYTHITPTQFLDDKTFNNWDLNRFHNKWIYDNRYGLAPFFINVTHSVLQTINALIGFIDFCEEAMPSPSMLSYINYALQNPEKSTTKRWKKFVAFCRKIQ